MPYPASMGGAKPSTPPRYVTQRIRALLNEAQDLTPEDYRPIVVVLRDTLSSSKTSGSDEYRVPTTHNLIVLGLLPHLMMTALVAGESLAVGNIGNPGFADRMLMKMQNCKVDLKYNDTTVKIFDNHSASLAALAAWSGQRVDWSEAPFLVPAGQTLHMDIALQQTDAAVVGGSTEYGIELYGALIRVKAS